MKVALLIGFQYQDDPEKYLPGILIDLYLAYQAVLKMSVDRFIMFTDIKSDLAVDLLRRALRDSVADTGVISFIEEARNKGFYRLYQDKANFIEQVSEIASDGNRIFVFYTGHGSNGDMLLPEDDSISMNYFRNIVVNNALLEAQVFFLMDCCDNTNLSLPWKLEGTDYKIQENFTPCRADVICLTSDNGRGDAHITEKGSPFSTSFFNNISKERLISKLVPIVDQQCSCKQKMLCYSSDPRLGVIWGWLLGLPDITCRFSIPLMSLIIRS